MDTSEESGKILPSAAYSRNKMQPDIPNARRALHSMGASDLAPMLFGEDN